MTASSGKRSGQATSGNPRYETIEGKVICQPKRSKPHIFQHGNYWFYIPATAGRVAKKNYGAEVFAAKLNYFPS